MGKIKDYVASERPRGRALPAGKRQQVRLDKLRMVDKVEPRSQGPRTETEEAATYLMFL